MRKRNGGNCQARADGTARYWLHLQAEWIYGYADAGRDDVYTEKEREGGRAFGDQDDNGNGARAENPETMSRQQKYDERLDGKRKELKCGLSRKCWTGLVASRDARVIGRRQRKEVQRAEHPALQQLLQRRCGNWPIRASHHWQGLGTTSRRLGVLMTCLVHRRGGWLERNEDESVP